MKKILIIGLCLILCGCGSKQVKEKETKKEVKEVEKVDSYQDNNNTVIGLYLEKGGSLELVKDYSTNIVSGKDIEVYQIYFSNEENISLSNGENINHTILNPSTTIQNEYILTYLYDDYKNRNSNFYSHIEDTEYNDETLFTSIKLFANKVDTLASSIEFTVFTYDTEDDFDSDGNYRGNSKYTIMISNNI